MGQQKALSMATLAEDTPAGLFRKKSVAVPGGKTIVSEDGERTLAKLLERRLTSSASNERASRLSRPRRGTSPSCASQGSRSTASTS